MSISARPRGIATLALLETIIGLVALGVGLSILGDIYLGKQRFWVTVVIAVSEAGLPGFLTYRIHCVLIALGILFLTVSYGTWKSRKWAYSLSILLCSLNVVLGFLSWPWGVILILFSLATIYYYTRPHIRKSLR